MRLPSSWWNEDAPDLEQEKPKLKTKKRSDGLYKGENWHDSPTKMQKYKFKRKLKHKMDKIARRENW